MRSAVEHSLGLCFNLFFRQAVRDLKPSSKANAKTLDEVLDKKQFLTQLALSPLSVQRPAAKAKGKAKAKAKA